MKLAHNVSYLRERVKLTLELWMPVKMLLKYLLYLRVSDVGCYFRARRSFNERKISLQRIIYFQ